jgi:hypothetical protein
MSFWVRSDRMDFSGLSSGRASAYLCISRAGQTISELRFEPPAIITYTAFRLKHDDFPKRTPQGWGILPGLGCHPLVSDAHHLDDVATAENMVKVTYVI